MTRTITWGYIIFILTEKKEYDKALEQFYKTLVYVPNHSKALNKIATIMFYKNDLKNAEKYIKKAIQADPESKQFHSTNSLILLKEGKPDQAIAEAKKGEEFNKNYLIGEAYRLKNDLNKSAVFYKRHLAQYPNQFPVNLALIEIYYLLEDQEALKQRVLHVMGLIEEKKLPEIILEFHKELNFLDYSRIKRIVNAITFTMGQQSDSLKPLLKEGLSEQTPVSRLRVQRFRVAGCKRSELKTSSTSTLLSRRARKAETEL